MGVLGEAGEDISAVLAAGPATAADAAPAAAPGGKVKISPAARKLAEDNGVDYNRISGTGPEGRITREDVEKAIEAGPGDERPTIKVQPYEGMRKAIGENMLASWNSNAKVTQHVSVDMSGILGPASNH